MITRFSGRSCQIRSGSLATGDRSWVGKRALTKQKAAGWGRSGFQDKHVHTAYQVLGMRALLDKHVSTDFKRVTPGDIRLHFLRKVKELEEAKTPYEVDAHGRLRSDWTFAGLNPEEDPIDSLRASGFGKRARVLATTPKEDLSEGLGAEEDTPEDTPEEGGDESIFTKKQARMQGAKILEGEEWKKIQLSRLLRAYNTLLRPGGEQTPIQPNATQGTSESEREATSSSSPTEGDEQSENPSHDAVASPGSTKQHRGQHHMSTYYHDPSLPAPPDMIATRVNPQSAKINYDKFSCIDHSELLGKPTDGDVSAQWDEHHQEFVFADTSTTKNFSDFRRIYLENFGGNFYYDPLVEAKRKSDTPVVGGNVHFTLQLTFDEALYGCSKEIEYDREAACINCHGSGHTRKIAQRCPQCHGNGRVEVPSGTYLMKQDCKVCLGKGTVAPPSCQRCTGTGVQRREEKTIIQVKPGTEDNSVWTLRGMGSSGTKGARSGDLKITYMIAEHSQFNRFGHDLHTVVPVPLSTALLGGVVQVPTLNGAKPLRVPAGIECGRLVSLTGLGVPNAEAKSRYHKKSSKRDDTEAPPAAGNLLIHLVVVIPGVGALNQMQRGCIDFITQTATEQTRYNQEQQHDEVESLEHDVTDAATTGVSDSERRGFGQRHPSEEEASSSSEAPSTEQPPASRSSEYQKVQMCAPFEGIPESAFATLSSGPQSRLQLESLTQLKKQYRSWFPHPKQRIKYQKEEAKARFYERSSMKDNYLGNQLYNR